MSSKDIEEFDALAEQASKSMSNYIDMLISMPLVACATAEATQKAAKVPTEQREALMVYSLAKSSLNLRESAPKASEMINDIVNRMEKNMIKKLIGKITQPKDLFVCACGDYWVSTFYYPDFNDRGQIELDYSGFSYRKVSQNRIGAWRAESQWMKTSYELQRASL